MAHRLVGYGLLWSIVKGALLQERQLIEPIIHTSNSRGLSTNVGVVDFNFTLPDVYGSSAIRSNGVTFTVQNTASEDIKLVGFDVFMSETPRNVIVQVFARPGTERKSPLEETSKEWTLVAQQDEVKVIFDAEFVSIPLNQPLKMEPNYGVTMFVFIETSAAIISLRNAYSSSITGEGGLTLTPGTAITSIMTNDLWVPVPDSGFLGKVYYITPENKAFKDEPPSPFSASTAQITNPDPLNTNGIMFDVSSPTGCSLTSLQFKTSSTGFIVIEVYQKLGSFKESTSSLKDWTLISKTSILGQGSDKLTSIPRSEFTTLQLPADTTMAFFVTSTKPDLLMLRSDSDVGSPTQESVFSGGNEAQLDIMVGQAVMGYPLGYSKKAGMGDNSLFWGELNYEAVKPLAPVTPAPTPYEFQTSKEDHVLEASMVGEEKGQGLAFDLQSTENNLVVRGLSILLVDPQDGSHEQLIDSLEVYSTKQSALKLEANPEDWFQIIPTVESFEKLANGQILVHYELEPSVLVAQFARRGFYATYPTKSMVFSYPEPHQGLDTIWATNKDLQMFMGNEVAYPFSSVIGPRGMNGKVSYTTTHVPKPPTAAPTPEVISSELESQVKLVITGMSRRSLRELSATMQNDEIRTYFEGLGSKFLNNLLNTPTSDGPPVFVNQFIVSPDISAADIESDNSFNYDSNQGKRRSLQENKESNEPKLEIYATILGEYSPPPVVDFSSLTVDSFNNKGDQFIENLKEENEDVGKNFADARSIRAEAVKFPKPDLTVEPAQAEAETEEPKKNFLIYVYIACGILGAMVIIIVILCIVLRKKDAKEHDSDHGTKAEATVNESAQPPQSQYNSAYGYQYPQGYRGGAGSVVAHHMLTDQHQVHDGSLVSKAAAPYYPHEPRRVNYAYEAGRERSIDEDQESFQELKGRHYEVTQNGDPYDYGPPQEGDRRLTWRTAMDRLSWRSRNSQSQHSSRRPSTTSTQWSGITR